MLAKLNVPANPEVGPMAAMIKQLVEVIKKNGSQILVRHFTCPPPAPE